MFQNKLMQPFSDMYENSEPPIPRKLKFIIKFKKVDGGIFFKHWVKGTNNLDIELIKERYLDLSGFEWSLNKISIDRYCKSNVFKNSFLFIKEFKKQWVKNFPDKTCITTLSFQTEFDDEPVELASFTFHLKRPGEIVISTDSLEDFVQPVRVEEIGPDSTPDDGVES